MAHQSSLIATDIEAYLDAQNHKGLLRFITCGSVDDGKSTLIGRMLYESHLVFDDHLRALESDSKRVGTQGDDLDMAKMDKIKVDDLNLRPDMFAVRLQRRAKLRDELSDAVPEIEKALG